MATSSSLSVLAIVALIVITSSVSSESNPRNNNGFRKLNKVSTSEHNTKRLAYLDDYEGSGDYDNYDDENGDDYYYDNSDEYDEEIYDYGKQTDVKIKHVDDESVKFHPDPKITHSNQDIHFGSSDNDDNDDLLEEYYEEEEYDDYDFEKNIKNEIIDEEAEEKSEEAEKKESSSMFAVPSYIYITLAAAALSFLVLAVCFVVCRNSVKSQRRRVKAAGRSDAGPFVIQSSSSGPIVKNYKSVPTNDFLTQPPPPSYEMALTVSDKLQRNLDNSSEEERERLNA